MCLEDGRFAVPRLWHIGSALSGTMKDGLDTELYDLTKELTPAEVEALRAKFIRYVSQLAAQTPHLTAAPKSPLESFYPQCWQCVRGRN